VGGYEVLADAMGRSKLLRGIIHLEENKGGVKY
jgi:hypothetical protein